MLRAALLEIGASADAENLALAESFIRLGLPLTPETLTEAHRALAAAPGATPLAFALAKALALPTSPATLVALATVTDGIPAHRALPADLMQWLGLALDAGLDAEALAAQLHLMANGARQSTESRLQEAVAEGRDPAQCQDTRATLLRLAQAAGDRGIQRGADTLAAHLEGQQLVNQAARQAQGNETPLYFAFPLLLPGEQTQTEMQFHPPPPEADWEGLPPDTPFLRATVRTATTRLGRVEAELVGTVAGALTCRLGAEKPATVRLLQRNAANLAAALAGLGWRVGAVECRPQADFPPLWHGGTALTAPRTRVDQRA